MEVLPTLCQHKIMFRKHFGVSVISLQERQKNILLVCWSAFDDAHKKMNQDYNNSQKI